MTSFDVELVKIPVCDVFKTCSLTDLLETVKSQCVETLSISEECLSIEEDYVSIAEDEDIVFHTDLLAGEKTVVLIFPLVEECTLELASSVYEIRLREDRVNDIRYRIL